MTLKVVTPTDLATPRGYSHGIVGTGRLLCVSGQIAWDAEGRVVSDRFEDQFDRALANVLAVVAEAGGHPESLARLTIYVTDKTAYLAAQKTIGERYRARMGRHYPAMTLVEVSALLEPGALVEIEAFAIL